MPYHRSKNVLFLAYLSFETKKVVGGSGLCDYRVSLTIIHEVFRSHFRPTAAYNVNLVDIYNYHETNLYRSKSDVVLT